MKKIFFIVMILMPILAFNQTKNGYFQEKSGNQTYAGHYVDGKMEGCWVRYNEKNLLREITEYKNDKKNGLTVSLNRQGSLELEEHYVDDVYHGEVRKYLRGNYLAEITTYNMGVKDGPYKRYYSDKPGVLMEEAVYVNGNKDGAAKWYSNTGKLLAEYSYKDGEFNGKNITYHENGQIMKVENYINNVPDGEWIEYDTTGQIILKENYVKGKLKK